MLEDPAGRRKDAAHVAYGTHLKITSPSKRVYIGQTTNFLQRHAGYRRLASASDEVAKTMNEWKQPKLRSSLRKHGYDAHKVEIILAGDVATAQD